MRSVARWAVASLLLAACAERPAGTGDDGSTQTGETSGTETDETGPVPDTPIEPDCEQGKQAHTGACYDERPLALPGHSLALGDFDADGNEDLAGSADPLIDAPNAREIGFMHGDGEGAFVAAPALALGGSCKTPERLHALPLASRTGLAWAQACGFEGWIDAFVWFGAEPVDLSSISFTAVFGGMAPGDLDGDGRTDLVLSVSHEVDPTPLESFLGDGNGGFTFHDWSGDQPEVPAALAVGDLSGDGHDDAVVVDIGSVLHVWLSDGEGGFVEGPSDAKLEPGIRRIWLARLDTSVDLLTLAGGAVQIRPGLGDGEFGPPTPLSIDGVSDVWVGDFDGQGPLDIVAASADDRAIYSIEDAVVESAIEVEHQPDVIVVGDLNGDVFPDLAYGSADDDKVRVLISR